MKLFFDILAWSAAAAIFVYIIRGYHLKKTEQFREGE